MATRSVVVGVDGSEESLLAAEWAAMEAKRHDRPLRIVSAPATMPRTLAGQASSATVVPTLREMSARALETAVGRAGEVATGLEITTELLSGPPALAVAGSGSGASMLVVGARGAGGFAAMILGSVSRYAALHAACPVIVVRQPTMAVHHEIAVGVGEPQDTSAALTFAFEEAAARHADLVVVHAWSWLGPEQIPAETADGLVAALERWQNKYPGVPAGHEIIRGHPGRVLASYSARADLVVIGRHGSSAVGSVQHALLDHARGPVAVVPSGELPPTAWSCLDTQPGHRIGRG